MAIFVYQCQHCDTNNIHEVILPVGSEPPVNVKCHCGLQANRKYTPLKVAYDGGQERFHGTTLAQERRAAEERIKNITDRPNSKYTRDMFAWKTHKELI